ncbi:amidase [Ramlibacter tataouinensis]|nr:amidase [Ramlibacter tataouinensis]WBY01244.1 amidase [Ramlibacter tataouinensis]
MANGSSSAGTSLPSAAAAALQRVAQRDGELRAFTSVADEALLRATPHIEGPLAGMPFGVKDVIDVAGLATRCGSTATPDRPAAFDASCVALLRAAGAVPVGKTVTAEYAFVHPGPTRNPHAPGHTPGGSSSGSAAAVAAGLVPAALGTQTGGSMIRPAAFCGVLGFKPSFGAVARDGMKITCESLDVVGWFGAGFDEIGKFASVLLPHCMAQQAPARAPRVAVIERVPGIEIDARAAQTVQRARERLAARGATILGPCELAEAPRWMEAHHAVMHYEFARSLLPVASVAAHALSRELLAAVDRGLAIPAERYLLMRAFQAEQRQRWHSQFGEADLVLTFSAPGPAPEGLHSTGDSSFNKAWSLLGWPCLHLPTSFTDEGLPMGVQLVAPWNADGELLAWARVLHPVVDERGASACALAA